MARIAVLEGVPSLGRLSRKERRESLAKKPQALKFKAALKSCANKSYKGTLHGAQKALGACIQDFYGKKPHVRRRRKK